MFNTEKWSLYMKLLSKKIKLLGSYNCQLRGTVDAMHKPRMRSSFTQRNPSASCVEQVPHIIGTIKVHATKPDPDPIYYQYIKYGARPYLFASLFASLHSGPGDSFFS